MKTTLETKTTPKKDFEVPPPFTWFFSRNTPYIIWKFIDDSHATTESKLEVLSGV